MNDIDISQKKLHLKKKKKNTTETKKQTVKAKYLKVKIIHIEIEDLKPTLESNEAVFVNGYKEKPKSSVCYRASDE